ncbi:uracil-DNA glycosylase [Alphaproteobacteria bacterium]|nr:uracil-DNA glycosylase [Alphaproteobacteria bacterium]
MFEYLTEAGWRAQLGSEFTQGYMTELVTFLADRANARAQIYPPLQTVFAAFNQTPFAKTKLVILGQDPYHGPGQAEGFSFSVAPSIAIPPSLRNIYTELESDLGIARPNHGNLAAWAGQGVLLLNACLTVEDGNAGSHNNRGWERFTDAAITQLTQNRVHLVFILWGRKAQEKGAHIDRSKHLVIETPHPSPLSAHKGFFGTKPFSRANDYLHSHNIAPIDWAIR